MGKLRISVIGLLIMMCLVVSNAYGGPIACDGELTPITAKATGQLLTAFGFAYTAIGFQEAGEPESVMYLRKLINPVFRAQTAGEYFQRFIRDKLNSDLKPLDTLVKKTDYKKLYNKEVLERGFFVPDRVWNEVSSRGAELGLKGLMEV